jgi:hypothetical protein
MNDPDFQLQVFAGVRSAKDGEEVQQKHPNILALSLEVTSTESIGKAAATVEAELTRRGIPLAALINNAVRRSGGTGTIGFGHLMMKVPLAFRGAF